MNLNTILFHISEERRTLSMKYSKSWHKTTRPNKIKTRSKQVRKKFKKSYKKPQKKLQKIKNIIFRNH